MDNHFFEAAAEKVKGFVKNIPEKLSGIGEHLREIPWKIQDSAAAFRRKRKKEKRKLEKLKRRLSPEEYQLYMRKRFLRNLIKGTAGVLCVALIFLAAGGTVKLVVMVGKRLGLSGGSQETVSEAVEPEKPVYEEKDITVGSTGCMLLHSPFLDTYVDQAGNYDFSEIYKFITPYYSAPDFMTCEFEGSLPGEDYSGYPTFRSPDAIIENIRDSGVDLQLLATNHVYDGLEEAFERMLEVYEEKGIPYTGIRRSTADRPYYVADIQGVKVGFVNYVYETEGEGVDLNGIAVSERDKDRINTFDYDYLDSFYNEMNKTVQDMKADGAQFIVADLHWGEEYELQEKDYQREIAQKLCNLGVNALIGGHPHCEEPIDVFTGRDGQKMFCIFSVGNALTNQRAELIDEMPTGHTEDGVIVTLKLHQDSEGTVSLTGVELLPTWVYRYLDDATRYYILPLDDVSGLEEKTGISGIREDAQASYDRTMEELGSGLRKAQEAFSADTAEAAVSEVPDQVSEAPDQN